MVNALGYGLLSPLAGWIVVGVDMNARTVGTWMLLLVWIMALYFGLQAYQYAEDSQRNYRTLVVVAGPRLTVRVSRLCLLVGVALLIILSAIGWYPRVCLLSFPVFWWADRWLVHWEKQTDFGGVGWAYGLIRRAGLAGLTLFLLVVGVYLWDSFRGGPVAGLATASGLPGLMTSDTYR